MQDIPTIWFNAKPVTVGQQNPVAKYLRAKGIYDFAGADLRYSRNSPVPNPCRLIVAPIAKWPALTAQITDTKGRMVGLFRRFLCEDGTRKESFTLLGESAMIAARQVQWLTKGAQLHAAIRLFEPVGGKVGIVHGIENALMLHQETHLPMWAIEWGFAGLALEKSIKDVVLFAGDSPREIADVRRLAIRLHGQGVNVSIKPIKRHFTQAA